MGRKQRWLLTSQAGDWVLVDASGETTRVAEMDLTLPVVAEAVTPRIQPTGRAAMGLILDSNSVLHFSFNLLEAGGARDESALRYRLEADLPLNAEESVVDFWFASSRRDTRVVALAADRRPLNDFVNQIESNRCTVQLISAASLLIAQFLVEQNRVPSSCVLVLARRTGPELLLLDSKGVFAWRLVEDPESVLRELQLMEGADSTQEIYLVGDAQELMRWPSEPGAPLVRLEADLERLAIEQGWAALTGKRSPWFNLTRDSTIGNRSPAGNLYRQANRLIWIASFGCLAVAAALGWRTERFVQSTLRLQQEQQTLFQRAFPDQQVPAAVHKRFRSEYAKVIGSRATNQDVLPRPVSAIPILEKMLDCLPQDVPFSLVELRIENGDFYVDLELDEHSQAAKIAESFEQAGLLVSPPKTEVSGSHVRALLRGSAEGETE